ncbi:1,3-beta-glucanase, partial [Streptomyces sp. NPDC001127]
MSDTSGIPPADHRRRRSFRRALVAVLTTLGLAAAAATTATHPPRPTAPGVPSGWTQVYMVDFYVAAR